MDQVKFEEDSLYKIWSDIADHIASIFLKAVFHKCHLIYSLILCPTCPSVRTHIFPFLFFVFFVCFLFCFFLFLFLCFCFFCFLFFVFFLNFTQWWRKEIRWLKWIFQKTSCLSYNEPKRSKMDPKCLENICHFFTESNLNQKTLKLYVFL